MSDTSIFGLPMEPDSEEIVPEGVLEESITSESLEAEETPVAGEPEAVVEAEAPEADPAAEPEAEAPQEEVVADDAPPRLWANKYQTPEELERGYSESRDMWRRANEARKAEAQRAMEVQEQYATLYRQMEQVIPVLQQAAQREAAYRQYAEAYRQQFGEYPQGLEPSAAPAPSQVGPQDVQQIVEQRLAAERQMMQAQFQQQQEYAQLEQAVMSFYQDHPEVEVGGPLDSEITDTMAHLNDSWDRWGIEIDPSDRGSLDIVYEAAQRPALLEVLKLNPQYFESAYGMELARRDAAILDGRVPSTTGSVTQQVPASQVKTSGQRKPYSESAAVGASAPQTEDENDPWTRIKNSPSQGATTSKAANKTVFFE